MFFVVFLILTAESQKFCQPEHPHFPLRQKRWGFNYVLRYVDKISPLLEDTNTYHHHHHHHVVPLERISLTLSHHFSLSFIASGRSSGLHPVSSHSCCMFELVVLLLLGHMMYSYGPRQTPIKYLI